MIRLRYLFLILVSIVIANVPLRSATDVTSSLLELGKPSTRGPYASNIWDMQVFNGRIYIGLGNSSNYTPESNSGSASGLIPILYFDPITGGFKNEFTSHDEQIDLFTVINGKLYSPSNDPTGPDSTGFYVLGTSWSELRSPSATVALRAYHTYDISAYNGKLYLAIGTYAPSTSQVNMTPDEGLTWAANTGSGRNTFGRAYALMQLDGNLYSLGYIYSRSTTLGIYYPVSMFDGVSWTFRDDLNWENLFPDSPLVTNGITPANQNDIDTLAARISRHGLYNGKLVYIAGYQWNDHQCFPFGLYMATSLAPGNVQVRKAVLPSGDIPWDILFRSDAVYVLTSQKRTNPESYIIKVFASSDLTNWTEQFRFVQPTFARSFEEANGDFYFGLGTDYGPDSGAGSSFGIYHSYTDTIHTYSGKILCVKSAAWDPEAPCSLTVTSQKPTSVSFSWQAPVSFPSVAGYYVLANGVQIGVVSSPRYDNAALAPGTESEFTVQAYDSAGGVSNLSAPLRVNAYIWKGLCEKDADGNNYPDDWGSRSFASLDKTTSHSGSGSLKINPSAVTPYFIAQNFPALKAGTAYQASAWIKTQNVSSGGIWLREVQTSPSTVVTSSASVRSEGLWTQVTFKFTTSPSFTAGLFEAAFDFTSGTAWLDDVVVAELPTDTISPAAPVTLGSTSQTTDSITLSWSPASDDIGVAGYYVTRNGVRIADVTSPSFIDFGLTSGTSYQYSIQSYDAAGNVSSAGNPLQVVTATPPQDPIVAWAAGYGLTGADTAQTANPTGDGLSNVMKYALDLNPTAVATASIPVVTLEGSHLALTYRYDTGKTGVSYRVETSTDLSTWTINGVTDSLVTTEGAIQLRKATVPIGSDSRKFLRLVISSATASGFTVPEGHISWTIPAASVVQTSYISLPLTKAPVYVGRVSTVGSTTLSVSGAPWSAGAFAQAETPYFVKVLSGAQAGRTLLISSNTANTLTVETTDHSSQTVALSATGFAVLAGDRIQVFAGNTLASQFGDGSEARPLSLRSGTSPFNADTVGIYNPFTLKWDTYYYNTTQSMWLLSGGAATNRNDTVLYPGEALVITRRVNTQNFALPIVGRVPEVSPLLKSIGSGQVRYVASFPTNVPIKNFIASDWKKSPLSFTADTLALWDPLLSKWVTYYQLANTGQWRKSGDSNTDQSNVIIPAGSAVAILKRDPLTDSASFLLAPLPYSSSN